MEDLLASPEAVIRACFTDLKVKLPLRLCDEDVGVVLDDDGCDVFTVDTNRLRDDETVAAIAYAVMSFINMSAGFDEVPADA
ncbi:hypothetical protein ABIA24_001764 [Sinorhizobium fredii]|uniref:hypothetical protein n=1 Tax=Rhizobium fredii TaxID=380 RepID=UPI003516BBB3